MNGKALGAAIATMLMLAACQRAANPAGEADQSNAAAMPAPPGNADAPAQATARNDVLADALDAVANAPLGELKPDLTPPVLTPEAERGEKGARNVLLSFARAIELKEYGQAWALLSAADKAKWSKAEFARMFAGLGKISVAVPTGTMEGAAGSSYYSAPVTITANDENGRPVRIEGKAVLRRANDVDGATAEQLRWHFETLTLDWTH